MSVFIILGAYLLLLLLAYTMQERMIFHPGKLSDGHKFDLGPEDEEVFLDTRDGQRINALYFAGTSDKIVLYFHGNAGDMSSWQYVSKDFVRLGYHFFLIDYRGYGKSSGSLSEEGLYEDARAAWDYVTNVKNFGPERIIIYGRSIGTGVAMELASRNEAGLLVLEAPYTDLSSLAKQKAPIVIPALTLRYHFDNLSKVGKVRSPILFIHGSDDRLIPPSHSRKLFDAFQGQKKLVIIEGGSHNDLSEHASYHEALQAM